MKTPHYPVKPAAAPATLGLAAALLLAACGGSPVVRGTGSLAIPLPVTWPATAPADAAAANAVSMRALSLLGVPYRYGGDSPETGFDCSGLIGYVYRDMLQRQLPRRSRELATLGVSITPPQMAAGDLVVFGDAAGANHVGIYLGEGRFVHAPTTGGSVRLDRLDGPYWRERFRGARRVLL